jgi:hypothetical protein
MSKDTYRTRTEGILYCIVPYYTVPFCSQFKNDNIICIFPAYLPWSCHRSLAVTCQNHHLCVFAIYRSRAFRPKLLSLQCTKLIEMVSPLPCTASIIISHHHLHRNHLNNRVGTCFSIPNIWDSNRDNVILWRNMVLCPVYVFVKQKEMTQNLRTQQ